MDTVLSVFLMGGSDPWNSAGQKLGGNARTETLSPEQQYEYIKTFVLNSRKHPAHYVLLHDNLSQEIIERHQSDLLKFEKVPVPALNNYEGRFTVLRNYLAAHGEIDKCWFIDVNDVAFAVMPFAWWAKLSPPDDVVFVGEEWHKYNNNPWFLGSYDKLPPEYKQVLLHSYGDMSPLSCGTWGAHRVVAISILNQMVEHIAYVNKYFESNPPPTPVMIDMYVFGYILLKHYSARLMPFKMNPTAVRYGLNSPVMHDRVEALKILEREDVVDLDLVPPELTARIVYTQLQPGWCPDIKAKQMASLVLHARPKLLVEIGVFGGRSALAQALALQYLNDGGTIYAIDAWDPGVARAGDDLWKARDAELHESYHRFVLAVAGMGLTRHVKIVAGASHLVDGNFQTESVDVLHIDGNHSEESSCRDAMAYLPKVKPGGYVWMDDTDWPSTQAAVAIVEAKCDLVRDFKQYRLYKKR